VKSDRLRALATADPVLLDAARLRRMPIGEALESLSTLAGIGPFSAELILVRGAGHPDVFPHHEPRLHKVMRRAYGLPESEDVAELARIAEAWRPYRSWVSFLMRQHAVR
jgi:DNA-3-methyladenine glycosylase II